MQKLEQNDREFLRELQSFIEAIARRWNWQSREKLQDIAQDCLLKLLENLRAGRFLGTSSFKTYVYAIVRNTCIDYYKLDATMATVAAETAGLADPGPGPDSAVKVRQERRLACHILLALPEKCRKLWRMIFFGKLNYRETAERLGVAEGSVKRQMWQCRQFAREIRMKLENQEGEAATKNVGRPDN
jgi:RNA polymerase sigma-70 factor (ECF subfamily)